MTTQRINDSLTSFTQRMPSAYVGSEQWYLHDIIRWRHFYRSHILAREAIDRIPDDCFRKGYNWGGADPEQINLLTKTERRLKVRENKKKALTFSRLDGEAYIYMDNGEDSSLPLDPERVRKDGLRFINTLRIEDLVKGPPVIDPMSAYYLMPEWYQVISSGGEQVFIHPSRMAKFIRNPDPTTFLGISDLALLYEPITMLERAEENVSELTTEARIDVMAVQGLMDAVQDPVVEEQIIKRYGLAADIKRTNKILVLDKEREEYNQKQTSFSGLPDVIESYRRGYCAASKIAYSLVFGRHGGLGSNGETDLISYYDNIATVQRTEVSDPCFTLNECIIRSALGSRPEEIFIDWLPLHEVSEKERVENAVKVADAVDKLVKSQAIPADVLTEPTVNWLVELGSFQGLEQTYNEWKDGGGVLDDGGEESDVIRGDTTASTMLNDAAPQPLYVSRKVVNSDDIVKWAREQGYKNILPEDDLHVTITYSREPVEWMKMGQPWQSKVTTEAGGPRVVDKFGKANVLLFRNGDIEWRHEQMVGLGASWDHPEYQPHITISYGDAPENVTPYSGEIVLGPEIFEPLNTDWKPLEVTDESPERRSMWDRINGIINRRTNS